MKLNMICIKFDQKVKKPIKPKFWTFEVLKNPSFSKPFSSPGVTRMPESCILCPSFADRFHQGF